MLIGIVNIVLGLWLMVSPAVFGMNRITSNINHIVGPLVITFSIISLWEINRNAIKVNILLGLWLLIALFLFDYTKTIAFFSNGGAACLIIIFSSIKRKGRGKFGGGWRSLFQHNPVHLREAEKHHRNYGSISLDRIFAG